MCDSGFISIVDPFLNPDGSQWTGSITYTLLYATTVPGATIVNAEQQFNVVNGINICLSPGLYRVVLQQNGFAYSITTSWGVPASGGPYTVAEIQGNITLQPNVLQANTITVTNEQMLALDTTAITLLPALGPNVIAWPIRLLCQQTNAFYVSGSQLLELAFGTLDSHTGVGSFGFLSGTGNAKDIDTLFLPGTLNGESTLYANLPLIGFADGPVTQPDGAGGTVTITTWYLTFSVQ